MCKYSWIVRLDTDSGADILGQLCHNSGAICIEKLLYMLYTTFLMRFRQRRCGFVGKAWFHRKGVWVNVQWRALKKKRQHFYYWKPIVKHPLKSFWDNRELLMFGNAINCPEQIEQLKRVSIISGGPSSSVHYMDNPVVLYFTYGGTARILNTWCQVSLQMTTDLLRSLQQPTQW